MNNDVSSSPLSPEIFPPYCELKKKTITKFSNYFNNNYNYKMTFF